MNVHNALASLASHVTTPVELAVTPLHEFSLERVIATPTTHERAPVHALRVPVTLPAQGSHRPRLGVRFAIVGGLVKVDHVLFGRLVVLLVLAHELGAAAVEAHLGGGVVAVLETIAHLPERRQLLPTRLEAARARHTVTFAGHFSVVVHRLKRQRIDIYLTVHSTHFSLRKSKTFL